MKDSEKTFQVLDTLGSKKISTQRELADHSGISLGQVNYILKSLLEKGLVKVGNFRKNPQKISYIYLLTPKGIEAKSKLAVKFVIRKLKEYEVVRERLKERMASIEKMGHVRVIFIGPSLVNEFIGSIIKESSLNLILVAHYPGWKDIDDIEEESFDIALLFDEGTDSMKRIEEKQRIPQNKLLTLW
jgi:EPS-associated MarR family transcriptional regulator